MGWGGGEDRSVIELRWKDLIRLGRRGVGDSSVTELRWKTSCAWAGGGGGWGGIVPSLNFVGKTSFALFSFVFPCFRIYSPSTFTNTYRHIHISTRDTCGGGGRSGQGGFGVDNSVIKELQRTLIIYAHSCSILTLPFVRLPLVEPL